MNKKIVELLQELQEECNKVKLPVVCGILEKDTDNSAALLGGSLAEQSLILCMLTELFKNDVENSTCTCSNCTALKNALGFEQRENESSSDLDDLLQTFLRGELN
ncbi:hypothetical protein MXE73_06910 [Enterococcus faecalis]|uniref:hypothetical protein n=1 Tax=Enterococcus faecalis TaxID=1351 RepID=UPI002DB60E68|nr:hypothetical protein [Enterococcus faecalis]MEB6043240.1 hypothetical protein [Enterococcus faecalis]MEB6173002.1 hypothetical protein [Enterococcus faecalis]